MRRNGETKIRLWSILLTLFCSIICASCSNYDIPPPPPPLPSRQGEEWKRTQPPPSYADKKPIHYTFPEVGEMNAAEEDRKAVKTNVSKSFPSRLLQSSSCALIGLMLSFFLSKSLHLPFKTWKTLAALPLTFFILCQFSRSKSNIYIEFLRSLGSMFLLSIGRYLKIRREYPALIHIFALLGVRRRRAVVYADEDRMVCTIAMVFFGAFLGSSFAFVPTSIGAVIGALLFPWICTLDNVRGDLFRTISLRIRAYIVELWRIVQELNILSQCQVLISKFLDTMLFLDRKHRIKDKLLALWNVFYAFVMRLVNTAQNRDTEQGVVDDRDRGGERRDEERKREPRGDQRMPRRHDFDRRRDDDFDRRRYGDERRGEEKRNDNFDERGYSDQGQDDERRGDEFHRRRDTDDEERQPKGFFKRKD